jgi:uncharacterized protein RhaS with RHS repeats
MASDFSIIATTDGGSTWAPKWTSTGNQALVAIEFPTPTTGYAAGTYGLILKTTDGGETWNPIPRMGTDSSSIVAYRYKYDRANRLREGAYHWYQRSKDDWNAVGQYREAMDYDPNGNITNLTRNNETGVAVSNNYSYIAGTNRLLALSPVVSMSISNKGPAKYTAPSLSMAASPVKIAAVGTSYSYDGNGNMMYDPNNTVKFIIYDNDNMPLVVYKGSQKIEYAYDAQGACISKRVGSTPTYYVNGADGKTESVTNEGVSVLYRYNIWGNDLIGHVRLYTTATRYYYLKDHLGSIRATVNTAGKIVSCDDYYPYGMIMPGRSMNIAADDERYKYTGKELDVETG